MSVSVNHSTEKENIQNQLRKFDEFIKNFINEAALSPFQRDLLRNLKNESFNFYTKEEIVEQYFKMVNMK